MTPGSLRTLLLVACFAWAGAPGLGDEDPAGRSVGEVAADVVTAFEAEGDERLADLAREVPPDPWRVADRLCADGHLDAAVAYAQAHPRPVVALLPTYVDRRREQPTPDAWREALEDARRLFGAGSYEKAERRLEDLVDFAAISELRAPEQEIVAAVDILALAGRAMLAADLTGGANFLVNAAHVADRIGWRLEVRRLVDEALLAVERLRDDHAETVAWRTARAQAVGFLVGIGRYEEAAPWLRTMFAEVEGSGNWLFVFDAGLSLGRCLRAMGNLEEAEQAFAHARAAAEAFAFDSLIGTALAEQASLAEQRGETREAIILREQAGHRFRTAGILGHEERMRFGNALLWRRLADYPKAFETFDRCAKIAAETGDVPRQAEILSQVGTTYRMLGSHRKAGEHLEKAIGLVGELGHPDFVAGIHQNLGSLRLAEGRAKEATASFERARALYTLAENPGGVAAACANLGLAHAALGGAEAALAWREKALETIEAAGLLEARAGILVGNGEVEARVGRVKLALRHLEEAARDAERLELPDVALKAHRARARVLYGAGRVEEALAASREALGWMPQVMGGLAEEESVGVRALHTSVFDVGVLCALKLYRPKDVLHFLEAGRAGALLESLGGRDLLSRAAIPAALAREESEARARAARARVRYREAVLTDRFVPIARARKALRAATEQFEKVVERVQRTKKSGAGLVYPSPATAEAIQADLPEGHALVLYAVLPGRIVAAVLGSGGLRVVDLGPSGPVLSRCTAFDEGAPPADLETFAATMRATLLEPLRLSEDVKTLVVSPSGSLAYVPFALLAPDLDVVYVPSGTTWSLLVEEAGPPVGKGVLAVGDPAYPPRTHVRLPETRIEAETVGTTVLVGAEATEARVLEAVRAAGRWRALHFACHGLVDTKRPLRSALALTPDADDDGSFTVLEVMRHDLSADLAVLSACDTGRGQVVRAEGIVGLTRAFMVAGAPRVLCSLWKVDDAATRALMLRFYERWSAEPGVTAARALREAQAHVRAQEAWTHPRYWAAWVLWGLP